MFKSLQELHQSSEHYQPFLSPTRSQINFSSALLSQYELAMPPKVRPVELEWWLASYTHFMVHQLSVYLA